MKKSFILWGGVLGLLAVILGAFGAHGLESQISPQQLDSFETGVRYQFYHALALLWVGMAYQMLPRKGFITAGWLFLAGVVLFSGSIYLLACRDLLGISSWTWLGPITPIGGTFFIIGWILLIIAAIRN
jgi:uncharacterized membrane protein YgdD (TMEM256/DUF423 family)